jgi:hypothetical protein
MSGWVWVGLRRVYLHHHVQVAAVSEAPEQARHQRGATRTAFEQRQTQQRPRLHRTMNRVSKSKAQR